ncbi:MAG: carboxypeptidase-like regulatory domain-containing protein, partial [Acidobacteriota bacterium]
MAIVNRDRFVSLCLPLIMTFVAPVLAQTTGGISGRVRDEESRPVTGVLVTARSPSLQGTRTASTDRDGHFRLPALPPGDYDVKAEREGFHLVE